MTFMVHVTHCWGGHWYLSKSALKIDKLKTSLSEVWGVVFSKILTFLSM